MHGNFAPFFFFFVCSIGFELSICVFSLKSWYVGKGNECQQRIFLVYIVWSQLNKVADLIYHNKISNIYLALHQLEASAVSDTFNYQHFEIRNCNWVSDIGVHISWLDNSGQFSMVIYFVLCLRLFSFLQKHLKSIMLSCWNSKMTSM
jgi:hypothetical protein